MNHEMYLTSTYKYYLHFICSRNSLGLLLTYIFKSRCLCGGKNKLLTSCRTRYVHLSIQCHDLHNLVAGFSHVIWPVFKFRIQPFWSLGGCSERRRLAFAHEVRGQNLEETLPPEMFRSTAELWIPLPAGHL